MPQVLTYIWQKSTWPDFHWDGAALLDLLGECRFRQGQLLARLKGLGFEMQQQARADVLVEEALKTSAIEGEMLQPDMVRSSVARMLGLPTAGLPAVVDRRTDGVVEILLDASRNYTEPPSAQRLFGWHAALFPTGYSGLRRIKVAGWRDDAAGPMRVVSGPLDRERVHYLAPPAERLESEMQRFIHWWAKGSRSLDGVLRAGVAHLWFVAIHPFDDGNGRIARALTEMALAGDEDQPYRCYSLSAQIMQEREAYYRILEHASQGDGEITEWLSWFLSCMTRAIGRSEELLSIVLEKHRFWQHNAGKALSGRQQKVINRLLDAGSEGFEGGMTNRKYAGIAHVSRATAQRELADLLGKGLLRLNPGGGRSTSYSLVPVDAPHGPVDDTVEEP